MYGNLSDLQSISYLESRPDNLIGVDLVHDLVSLVDTLYTEPGDVRVVVIDSASPEFFSGHVDLTAIPQYTAEAAKAGGPGDASLGMFLYKLAHVPVITIAKVRGRARGGGNELALACDMIFASRENAIFGPFESGTGALPGAGGIQHLTPRLGRTRAIEGITGADDFDADLAVLLLLRTALAGRGRAARPGSADRSAGARSGRGPGTDGRARP